MSRHGTVSMDQRTALLETSPQPSLPFVSSRIVVFSDFNCPYCFTLNEWLAELGVSDRVRWVGIEHKPDLPTQGENRSADATLLREEVADVGRRAPDLGVTVPRFWANSREALLLQNAVEDDDPEVAPRLRRVIFRRYWRDGGMPFGVEALEEILGGLSIDKPIVEPEYLEEMTDWWRAELDRIPVMVAPTGVTHLGLQDKKRVRAFLHSAIRPSTAGPGCR